MLSTEEATAAAAALMQAFADNTGLTAEGPGRRYLWTDAFAVCNFLALQRRTGQARYLELALRLVARVHHVLGRHRADDSRTGWLSGLGEQAGEEHPTHGGLRIGKKLAERRPGEPFDEQTEWERDGQYFHYLTRWMHALDLVARSTRQARYNLWARELAEVAHRSFVYGAPAEGRGRMFWKMSIDLSRPLVASMGHHDPLDGFLTCVEMQGTAARLSAAPKGPGLQQESADFASMIHSRDLATADPLGLGGLLMDASRVAQLMATEAFEGEQLMDALFVAAQQGLSHYSRQTDLRQPASRRLAFRELGLAIGLSAIELVAHEVEEGRLRFAGSVRFADALEALQPCSALGTSIVSFWMDAENRQARSWRDHQDINDVMLATSLVPEGCVMLPPTP